jgi:hypothetical protein
MLLNNYLKIGALCLLTSLSACDSSEETHKEANPKQIITLNDSNLNAFTIEFANHYLTTLKGLTDAYQKAKKSDDAFSFVQYRNYEWTPSYVEKKRYYQAVQEKNKAFLSNTHTQKLFAPFERLIFVGIELKKGLSNNDKTLIKKAYTTIKRDHHIVKTVLAASRNK